MSESASIGAVREVLGAVVAAVVGLLAAALYDPVFTSGVQSLPDVAIAAGGLAILRLTKQSPLWVVVWCIAGALLTR